MWALTLNVLNLMKIERLKISTKAAAECRNTCIDVEINGQFLSHIMDFKWNYM